MSLDEIKAIALFVPGLLAMVFLIVMYVFGIRRMWGDQKACTERVVGTVLGPSNIHYVGHHVPLCRYEAEGQAFEVAGPLFEWGSTGGLVRKSNLTDREHLPRRLVAPMITWTGEDGDAGPGFAAWSNEDLYAVSALAELYPAGSDVDIWYEPGNPGNAYVQRPVRTRLFLVVFCAGWAVGSALCFALIWALL